MWWVRPTVHGEAGCKFHDEHTENTQRDLEYQNDTVVPEEICTKRHKIKMTLSSLAPPRYGLLLERFHCGAGDLLSLTLAHRSYFRRRSLPWTGGT